MCVLFFYGGHDACGVLENDTWETQRVDETEIRLTCGSLAMTSELIRSLRDDEQVKSQEPRMCKWLRVHDKSEWSPYEEPAGGSLRRMFPL